MSENLEELNDNVNPLEEEIDLNSMNEQQLANYQHWIGLVKQEFTSDKFLSKDEFYAKYGPRDLGYDPTKVPHPLLKITLKLKEENINYKLPFYETFITYIFRNGYLIKKYSTMLFLGGINKETGEYQYEKNIGERDLSGSVMRNIHPGISISDLHTGMSSKQLTLDGKYEIDEIAVFGDICLS